LTGNLVHLRGEFGTSSINKISDIKASASPKKEKEVLFVKKARVCVGARANIVS
jgi:hypothetical protein